MNLSMKQKDIVEHIDGALLVKAGPGSGKTRVLTERIKYLLSAKKRGKVLALTFSNMAAEEMRARLEADAQIGESIERITIGTIHSFCLDIVQSRGYLVGLQADVSLFENESDRIAILRGVLSNDAYLKSLLQQQQKPETFLSRCLSIISEQKRSFITPNLCKIEAPFPAIYQKYNETLFSQNAMDFDDIMLYAYRILAENPDVVKLYNSVYRYICVDEAQDLNNAQYRLIQTLCGTDFCNVMMVGDENQSIYAFNGSSSKYMSELFVHDFNPIIYSLNENFRSAKQIIQFANTLTGNDEDITQYVYEGEVSVNKFDSEASEAQHICSEIQKLVSMGHKDIENPLKFDDFAVIARNKYVFFSIEFELAKHQIPFYYKKTQSGVSFETDHMEVFDLIMRLVMNPMDLYHKQILCKMLSSDISSCVSYENINIFIKHLVSESNYAWLNLALPYVTTESDFNFDKAISTLKTNIPATLPDDERYLLEKDIDELNSHWTKYKSRIASENRTLTSFRNAVSLGKTQNVSSDSGVALLTAHMSKGLEFEAVFIIGLSEGTFPDYRAVNGNSDAMVQEKNNMYVAVTRAKRLCYMSYSEYKKMPWGDIKKQQPSRFIKQLQINHISNSSNSTES